MKTLILLLFCCVTFFASCSRSEFELPPQQEARPEINSVSTHTAYLRFKLDGRWVTADSLQASRNTALQTMTVQAKAGAIILTIEVKHITQTGNATGLILAGSYTVTAGKQADESFRKFETISQTLWIYTDNPLTAPACNGRFALDAIAQSGGEGLRLSEGEFRVRF